MTDSSTRTTTRRSTTDSWQQATRSHERNDSNARAQASNAEAKVARVGLDSGVGAWNPADAMGAADPQRDPERATAQRASFAARDKQVQAQLMGALPADRVTSSGPEAGAAQPRGLAKLSGDAARDQREVLDALNAGTGAFHAENPNLYKVRGLELWRTERDNIIAMDRNGAETKFPKDSPVEKKLRELDPAPKDTDDAKMVARIKAMSDPEVRAFVADEERWLSARTLLEEGTHPRAGHARARLDDAREQVAPQPPVDNSLPPGMLQ